MADPTPDPATSYRDLLAAIRDALTLPLPGIADRDRELCRVTTDARADATRIASEMVTRDGSLPSIHRATEWLRSRIGQLPITYRTYEPARPEGGNLGLLPPEPQVAPSLTDREAADVR